MLKGINKIISPELLMYLDKMGHGDEIVFSDGNFPGESIGRIVLRADAVGVPELMQAVLELFPLDAYDNNVYLMDKTESDRDLDVPITRKLRRSTRTRPPFSSSASRFTSGRGRPTAWL